MWISFRCKSGGLVDHFWVQFNTMFFWSKETGVSLGFIQPGKPTQNAFVESLNGKFRNECLNQHWFRTMDEARYEIDLWREHYNHVRPHSSLNYMSPVEYAKQAA